MLEKIYDTEAMLQTAVVNYIKLKYPKVLLCASLGGLFLNSPFQRRKGKATGYSRGFPDLFIYEPNDKYNGLAIELKLDKRCYASKFQLDWVRDLNKRGYYAEVCKGYNDTINLIDKYLNNE